MTERFKNAYDALYDAFMNDKLKAGDCTACAVGNILRSNLDKLMNEFDKTDEFLGRLNNASDIIRKQKVVTLWRRVFVTSEGKQRTNFGSFKELEQLLTEMTDYSPEELAQIEYAFETNTKLKIKDYTERLTPEEIMEDQFNGLQAVMDVLIRLDDIEGGDVYKETFRNKFATCE